MRSPMTRTSVAGFESCCAALRSTTSDLRRLFGKVSSSVDAVICVAGETGANIPAAMKRMEDETESGFVRAR